MASIEPIVSDYVAGRLDRTTAREIETAAQGNRRMALAIAEARAVHIRVREKLKRCPAFERA